MRRAIAGVIMTGLGILALAAIPARGAVSAAGTPRASESFATKTVAYSGLELTVPAAWPVYRLDRQPATCVRYDIHAVYLGTPGVNQQCPAHLVGRTLTVSIVPAIASPRAAASRSSYRLARLGMTGGTQVGRLPSVRAQLVQAGDEHVLRVNVNAAGGATVIATYAESPVPAEQVLSTLRLVPSGRASRESPAPAGPRTAALLPRPLGTRPQRPPHPVYGFDTCAAPSLATMRKWRRAYSVVGIYIGGVNAACGSGNLSAFWIRSAARMGWTMLPTYVGPQAACWGGGGVLINARHAAAEGRAAANDAISDLALLGLRKGSPVYYDMEDYDRHKAGCVSAVLSFIGAWSRQLAARGYVPAVYASQNSGIVDMEAAAVSHRQGFTPPKAIWIALWDLRRTLSDGRLIWPAADRSKQYVGAHFQRVGGITLDIDTDWVEGPVAR
jgi:hypothetical protein